MNYWFVVHDLKAYEQHNDMIGCRVKRSGSRQPWFKQFAEIKKGDKIVITLLATMSWSEFLM